MNTEKTILQVPIEDIIPNRFQPRLSFDDESLKDLASSIKQHGIIQPLVLRRINDKYEIIAGERRFKAAKMAGLISVPAVISNLDDNASAEVAIVENIQRKDLTSIEEAKSYQALLDKGYMTQEELAKKMGLSQSAISNKLRLLTLDDAVQEAILAEKISERHARTLLKVPSHEKQRELLNRIINERLTVKQLEDEIKNIDFTNKIEQMPVNNIEDIFDEAINEEEKMNTNENLFATPEAMPNKFFNFLEDTAANMDITEPQKSSENIDDGIELLDFSEPSTQTNNDYLTKVIDAIRNLNLDPDRVSIEELNLSDEYHINITIKKDN